MASPSKDPVPSSTAAAHSSQNANVRIPERQYFDKTHVDSFNGCVSSGNAHLLFGKPRSRTQQAMKSGLRSWIVQQQKAVFTSLLLLHAVIHICLPRVRTTTLWFVQLAYFSPSSYTFDRGPADLCYVAYWIVLFSALRALAMDLVLMPLTSTLGIRRLKTRIRFTEQAWMLIYYGIFWPLGMYVMYQSEYWFNLREMWTNFPTRTMDGLMKWYYLVQLAFWLQQVLVINLEERRKDHWQMFTHHIVTIMLISMSYAYYHTKVGNVILCIMDQVDLVLAAAKMLKYAGYQTACDFAFGVFILSWFITRHVFYMIVCWSIWVDVPSEIPYGCYSMTNGAFAQTPTDEADSQASQILNNLLQSFLSPGSPVCFNKSIHYTFLGLLLFLQGLTIIWFGMIIRVAWRVVKGDGADDSRSDDEEEGEVAEEEEEEEKLFETVAKAEPFQLLKPVEQFVGVEALNLRKKTGPFFRNRKSSSHTAGISISGHGDRKELLGRIGCDKPS